MTNKHEALLKSFTDEQLHVYKKTSWQRCFHKKRGFFVLYGYGGTCKTFM